MESIPPPGYDNFYPPPPSTQDQGKEATDRGNEFGALLTYLSKAFECINHPLLIAKLYNYGVLPLSVNIIFSYLSNLTH